MRLKKRNLLYFGFVVNKFVNSFNLDFHKTHELFLKEPLKKSFWSKITQLTPVCFKTLKMKKQLRFIYFEVCKYYFTFISINLLCKIYAYKGEQTVIICQNERNLSFIKTF